MLCQVKYGLVRKADGEAAASDGVAAVPLALPMLLNRRAARAASCVSGVDAWRTVRVIVIALRPSGRSWFTTAAAGVALDATVWTDPTATNAAVTAMNPARTVRKPPSFTNRELL